MQGVWEHLLQGRYQARRATNCSASLQHPYYPEIASSSVYPAGSPGERPVPDSGTGKAEPHDRLPLTPTPCGVMLAADKRGNAVEPRIQMNLET